MTIDQWWAEASDAERNALVAEKVMDCAGNRRKRELAALKALGVEVPG